MRPLPDRFKQLLPLFHIDKLYSLDDTRNEFPFIFPTHYNKQKHYKSGRK